MHWNSTFFIPDIDNKGSSPTFISSGYIKIIGVNTIPANYWQSVKLFNERIASM